MFEQKETKHIHIQPRVFSDDWTQLVYVCILAYWCAFGEIVGGANSIKFNSTYFSAWALDVFAAYVCESERVWVNRFYSCVCLCIIHSRGTRRMLSCLSAFEEREIHFSRKLCLDVYELCGMATVCVLIGSFNNHPKWQTIGWIKYTCWLNYRCNVVLPHRYNHIHKRSHTLFRPHIASHIRCQTYTSVYGFLCVFVVFPLWFLVILTSKWEKRRENYVAYTQRYNISINEIDCRGTHPRMLSASNWRSGINWWSILFSSVLVFVCMCLCACVLHSKSEQFLLSFQSGKNPKTMYWIHFRYFGVLVKRSSSAFCSPQNVYT